jgi:hypothetical protein
MHVNLSKRRTRCISLEASTPRPPILALTQLAIVARNWHEFARTHGAICLDVYRLKRTRDSFRAIKAKRVVGPAVPGRVGEPYKQDPAMFSFVVECQVIGKPVKVLNRPRVERGRIEAEPETDRQAGCAFQRLAKIAHDFRGLFESGLWRRLLVVSKPVLRDRRGLHS